MKIAIITSCSGISSRRLAEHLKVNGHVADVFHPFKDGRTDLNNYNYVFSYGCSAATVHRKRINSNSAVSVCVNKATTFAAFNRHGIPTVEWTTEHAKIPKKWEQVVCRTIDGRKAEGIDYIFQEDGIPKGKYSLFTEVYHGKFEYRVMVFKDWVGVYFKSEKNGDWTFKKQSNRGFEKMIDDAKRAAKALGIDYVGFDVFAKNKGSYVFLEANSGPALTPEASTEIVTFFNSL